MSHFPTSRKADVPPGLSPSQRKAAEALGLAVVAAGLKVTVRCPFCPGVRTVTPNLLVIWAKKGRVPACESVKKQNVGTNCKPPGAEGVADAPGR